MVRALSPLADLIDEINQKDLLRLNVYIKVTIQREKIIQIVCVSPLSSALLSCSIDRSFGFTIIMLIPILLYTLFSFVYQFIYKLQLSDFVSYSFQLNYLLY